MRSFQFSDASSHKFWSIDVRGAKHVIKFGKVGAAGQTQEKTFSTPELAQAEADKLIREKTRKGYAETTPGAGSSSTADALENAIRANPDDRAAHAAYADYLTEQGDPRGEFIQVQLALEDESLKKPERKKLEKREADLLKKHEKEWVGAWADQVPVAEKWHDGIDPLGGKKYAFERGLLTTINAERLTVAGARAIVKDPATRFVRNLYIGRLAYDHEQESVAPGPDLPRGATEDLAQYPLLRWPYLKHVRRFMWGWPAEVAEDGCTRGTEHYFSCHLDGRVAYDYVKQMPDIEELHLYAHVRDKVPDKIVALPMPRLRVFALYHSWNYPLDKLAANKSLTNLTHILCHPHGLEHDAPPYIRLKQLRAICQSQVLTNLTHLRLRLSDFGDKGADEIASSGLLQRLKVLDVQHGCMTDKGAAVLAASPDLRNLSVLNVSYNALTTAGVAALRKTGVTLIAEQMHTETRFDPDDENEFLGYGDAE